MFAGKKGTGGEVLGIASSDDHAGNALHVSVSFSVLDISVVDHLPEELVALTIKGLSFGVALGIGPEGTFQRMQLSVQKLQIDDQLSASRYHAQCQWLCHSCAFRAFFLCFFVLFWEGRILIRDGRIFLSSFCVHTGMDVSIAMSIAGRLNMRILAFLPYYT